MPSIKTVAGTNTPGYVDGPALTAQFAWLSGMCSAQLGSTKWGLFVSDFPNNVIRKFTPATAATPAKVKTVAGSTAGYQNGSLLTSKFWAPYSICGPVFGNLFVTDHNNAAIRVISASGVQTYAGGGTSGGLSAAGYANGSGSSAKFASPTGIAVSNSMLVYLSDQNTSVIRRIASSNATLYAGAQYDYGYVDGPVANAKFASARSVALDTAGNVFVADGFNNVIRKISITGIVSTYAGTGVAGHIDGPLASAQFTNPVDLTFDAAGNLYVRDYNYYIRKIDTAGMVSTIAGTGVAGTLDGPINVAQLAAPWGPMAFMLGTLYFCDGTRIRCIDP